mmetsp:Transcript_43722/g.105453  ORF Transcript_43722/g.105453 Transcript_43722/m.105453 type:complete len:272 (+) Transcript_43722:364-1179(+)
MVLHLLNRNQSCYLGVLYDEGPHKQFDHGCNSCTRVYNAFNRQWPGIVQAIPNVTVEKFDSTKIWKGVLHAGGEKKYSYVRCRRCDEARMTIGRLWVDVVKGLAAERNVPILDVVIHIRKGDFPRKLSKTYAKVINGFFPNVPLDVFTENSGEASELWKQVQRAHEVRIHEGGEAVEDWLKMAKARVLFVHESSFSISASIASDGIVFSQAQKPYQGRYDNHYFPCKLDDGWWASTGGHGNTTCDVEKINDVSRTLVEKYGVVEPSKYTYQ